MYVVRFHVYAYERPDRNQFIYESLFLGGMFTFRIKHSVFILNPNLTNTSKVNIFKFLEF